MARAQQASSIEQARLFQNTPTTSSVNADGTALPDADAEASSDDSFGTQVILKKRERVRTVALTGDTSAFFTDNAALTRHDKIDDVFFVTNLGLSWTPRINSRLEAQIAARSSIFRYASTSSLDFENLGAGAALFWSPEHFCDIGFFARYDFTELLDRHSSEIFRDHEFSVGAQKIFVVGKSQSFTLGVTGMGGIADPSSVQRQTAGLFAGYRWQITSRLDAEVFYRFSAYFYDRADRMDCNHIVSGSVRYRVSRSADLNAFVSFGGNRSDTSGFDYNVVTAGGGVGFTVRF
jgi:hypothetical protein